MPAPETALASLDFDEGTLSQRTSRAAGLTAPPHRYTILLVVPLLHPSSSVFNTTSSCNDLVQPSGSSHANLWPGGKELQDHSAYMHWRSNRHDSAGLRSLPMHRGESRSRAAPLAQGKAPHVKSFVQPALPVRSGCSMSEGPAPAPGEAAVVGPVRRQLGPPHLPSTG